MIEPRWVEEVTFPCVECEELIVVREGSLDDEHQIACPRCGLKHRPSQGWWCA